MNQNNSFHHGEKNISENTHPHTSLASYKAHVSTRIGEIIETMGQEEYSVFLNREGPTKIEKKTSKEPMNITPLDLPEFPLTNEIEIIEFIEKKTKLPLTSPEKQQEAIRKIDELFERAKTFYKERYGKHLPKEIERKRIRSIKDIVQFIKNTQNKPYGNFYCAMTKIIYALCDIAQYETLPYVVEKLDDIFVNTYLLGRFQFEQVPEQDYYKGKYVYRKNEGKNEVIDFTIRTREKTLDSILGKIISQPEYYSLDALKDHIGVTFYVNNEKHALYLMEYIDQVVFHGEGNVHNKGILTRNLLLGVIGDFIDCFGKKMTDCLDSEKRKKHTALGYQDIKITGKVPLPYEDTQNAGERKFGVEIKFCIHGHDNEKGLSHHLIYDYAKRFGELTRLGIPIYEEDIARYVEEIFQKLPHSLEKQRKTLEQYYKELEEELKKEGFIEEIPSSQRKKKEQYENILKQGITKYFHTFLIPVGKGKQKFFVHPRLLDIQETLFPNHPLVKQV